MFNVQPVERRNDRSMVDNANGRLEPSQRMNEFGMKTKLESKNRPSTIDRLTMAAAAAAEAAETKRIGIEIELYEREKINLSIAAAAICRLAAEIRTIFASSTRSRISLSFGHIHYKCVIIVAEQNPNDLSPFFFRRPRWFFLLLLLFAFRL